MSDERKDTAPVLLLTASSLVGCSEINRFSPAFSPEYHIAPAGKTDVSCFRLEQHITYMHILCEIQACLLTGEERRDNI